MTATKPIPTHSDPVHQSIEHISSYFDSIGAEVSLWRYAASCFDDSERWQGKVELDNRKRGIALKCEATASSLFDLCFALYHKVKSLDEVGIPDEVFGRTALPPPDIDESREMTREQAHEYLGDEQDKFRTEF